MSSFLSKLACASAVLLASFASYSPAQSAEVTLNAASCFPIGSPPSRPFEALVKTINEKGKGLVKVDMKGGAPAIGSPFTLVQKMSKGIYDFVGCTESYFGNVFTEAAVLRLAEHPYSELRKNGGIAMVSELLSKKNITYLGRYGQEGPFHLWLAKKIDKPDLKGMHLRVSPIYTAFFKSLGATVQTSNLSQIYTYMENGTVQGYGWPTLALIPSWLKVTKYRVDPGFYTATVHALVNQKKWKTLSKEQQDFLQKTVLEFEAKSETNSEIVKKRVAAQDEKIKKAGIEIISFEGADREKWANAASKAAWDEVVKRSPAFGPKLKKLFTK